MVSNADTLPETSIPKGLEGKIGKAREVVLEALYLQSTHEGCAEEQAWAREGQNKHTVQVTKTNFQPVLGEAGQRTECRPQSQYGKGCWHHGGKSLPFP